MTALGFEIGWLTIRVTLVTLVALVFGFWCARRAARSAVVILATGMMVLLALTAAAFCPMPNFAGWLTAVPSATAPRIVGTDEGSALPAADVQPQGTRPLFTKAWDAMKDLSNQATESLAWQNGAVFIAVLYAVGVGVAALRLLSSWLAIRGLQRRSKPIYDANLWAVTNALRLAMGCRRRLQLRESGEPGSAATIGWWRPVIFLPPEWRGWTSVEKQAVLAHELAHIRFADYLVCIWTCLCQVLLFHHPLVHWLSAQLRWQQELAADQLAGSIHENPSQYLKALASLALRTSPRMAAGAMPWSAMTGGTLIRRIAMLRTMRKCTPVGWRMRGLLVGLVAAVGLSVTSLGSSATAPDEPEATTEPFDIRYLPDDAQAFLAFRPAVILKQPGMDKMGPFINLLMMESDLFFAFWPAELKAENIEQVVTNVRVTSAGTGKPHSRSLFWSANYLRLDKDFDWPAHFRNLLKQPNVLTKFGQYMVAVGCKIEVKEFPDESSTIYRLRFAGEGMGSARLVYFHMPDARTLVASETAFEAALADKDAGIEGFRKLVRKATTGTKRDWGTGYDKVARAPLALVVDNHDRHFSKLLAKDLGAYALGTIENIRFAAVGIELGDGRPVRLVVDAQSGAAATQLANVAEESADSLLEMVRQYKADDAQFKTTIKWMALHILNDRVPTGSRLVEELLQSRRQQHDDLHLEWCGYSSLRLRDIFSFDADKYYNHLLQEFLKSK